MSDYGEGLTLTLDELETLQQLVTPGSRVVEAFPYTAWLVRRLIANGVTPTRGSVAGLES